MDKENCILYVPAGAAATYATTDGWKDFKNIVEIKNTYKVTFVVDDKEFVINSISEGDKIIYPEVPQKEGYTFKWDTIINTMPSNDITIKGRYIALATLQIPDLDMKYDETKEVSIEMNNEVAIRALQVRVVLPKGITLASAPQLVQERVGSGVDEFGDNVTAQKSLNYNMWADGSYMITVNSDDGLPFAGNKGSVIKFSVKADYFVRGTTQKIELKDIELVNVDGDTNYRPSDGSSLISISCNTITYKVDGEIYQVLNVPYGATIEPIAAPIKEGYTFSGWSEIPATMPANNVVVEGSFFVNSYTVTFMVDSEVYKTMIVEYGATITPITEPTKEGHTFIGWSGIPETMPANDVVVEGTFSINSYTVTFMVDGEVYDTMTIEYGATIEPIAEPTKEGHTFSGWSDIPATMPAEDIIVTAQFSVNSYTISFMVDGEVYKSLTVKYGDSIPAVEVPTLDGYIFDSWDEIPETMPAEDIIIESYWLIPGDVNNDGRISVLDITILTNHILRINDNSIFKQQAADMNSDGRISIVDVTKVTNKILE